MWINCDHNPIMRGYVHNYIYEPKRMPILAYGHMRLASDERIPTVGINQRDAIKKSPNVIVAIR